MVWIHFHEGANEIFQNARPSPANECGRQKRVTGARDNSHVWFKRIVQDNHEAGESGSFLLYWNFEDQLGILSIALRSILVVSVRSSEVQPIRLSTCVCVQFRSGTCTYLLFFHSRLSYLYINRYKTNIIPMITSMKGLFCQISKTMGDLDQTPINLSLLMANLSNNTYIVLITQLLILIIREKRLGRIM